MTQKDKEEEDTDCYELVSDMIALAQQHNDGGWFESMGLGSDIMDRYTNPGSHGRFLFGNWFGQEPAPYRLQGTTGFRPILTQGGQNTDLLRHVATGASAALHRVGEATAFAGSMYDTLQWVDSFGPDPDIPFVTAGKNPDGLATNAEIAGNYIGVNVGGQLRGFLGGNSNEAELRAALTKELCE